MGRSQCDLNSGYNTIRHAMLSLESPGCFSGMLIDHVHRDRSVEEPQNLASDVFSPGLLMIHDASRCGEDDVAKLTRRQKLDNPLLQVAELNVVSGRDDTGLVEA